MNAVFNVSSRLGTPLGVRHGKKQWASSPAFTPQAKKVAKNNPEHPDAGRKSQEVSLVLKQRLVKQALQLFTRPGRDLTPYANRLWCNPGAVLRSVC